MDAVAAAGNAADLFPASSRSPPSSSNHTSVVDFLEGAEVERCIHFNNPETCTYGACGRRNGSLQLYSADPDPDPDPQPNAAAAPTSGEGVCSICEEDAAHVRSVEWLLDDEGSPIEQFDKDVCDHHFCLECLGHWVGFELLEIIPACLHYNCTYPNVLWQLVRYTRQSWRACHTSVERAIPVPSHQCRRREVVLPRHMHLVDSIVFAAVHSR